MRNKSFPESCIPLRRLRNYRDGVKRQIAYGLYCATARLTPMQWRLSIILFCSLSVTAYSYIAWHTSVVHLVHKSCISIPSANGRVYQATDSLQLYFQIPPGNVHRRGQSASINHFKKH